MTDSAVPHPRLRRSRHRGRREVLFPLAIVVACATVAFASRPGVYVADFRFELAWAPDKTLDRVTKIWQSVDGLGGVVGTDRSPLPAVFFWVVRSAGAEPWVAQRLWFATLMSLGALGIVSIVRFFAPRLGIWHAIAALTYTLSPLALTSLVPSPIVAVHYVAPLVLASLYHGAGRANPWRWAGVFALCMLLVAPVELPGAMLLVAYLPLYAWLLVAMQRETTWRRVGGWALRAGSLSLLCLLPVVIRSQQAGAALDRRLFITESPEVVASNSSWGEAFRGLGHWLLYFRIGDNIPRENLTSFLANGFVVAATFAVPVVGIGFGLRKRWPAGRALLLVGIASLVAVVGLYTPDDPTPWGELVGWMHERLPRTIAFRNTTKAAWPFAIAVAVLVGSAADRLAGFLSRADSAIPPWHRPAVVAAAATAVAVMVGMAAWPAFSNRLYPPGTLTAIPDYWYEATDWVNANAQAGETLILPGSPAVEYRWGDPGDDIFQALLDDTHLLPNYFSTSAPAATNILQEIDTRLRSERLEAQSLTPLLERLGVRYVVLRSDLDWESTGLLRPAALTVLREDPAFELVASFGRPGQNTTVPLGEDPSDLERLVAQLEAAVSPVEIYEIGSGRGVRTVDSTRRLVLAGDANGWFQAENLGLISDRWPISYVSRLDDNDLTALFDDGSPVLITDSNRRQIVRSNGPIALVSPVEFAAETEDRPGALFDTPGAQSVLWSPDVIRVTESTDSLAQPATRAQQAFDGNAGTAWRVPPLVPPEGESITVILEDALSIDRIGVTTAGGEDREVNAISIQLDDRPPVNVPVRNENASTRFDGIEAESVTITLTATSGAGTERVGIAEVDIEGLELRTVVQTPTELFDRAETDATLARSLTDVPVAYSFERLTTRQNPLIESNLRRRFAVDRLRDFHLSGRIRLNTLLGDNPVGCVPWLALDGRPLEIRVDVAAADRFGVAPFDSCEVVSIDEGTHLIEADRSHRLDAVALVDVEFPRGERPAVDLQVSQTDSTTTHRSYTVDGARPGDAMITGLAFHEGWRAEVDGQAVPTTEIDAQLAVALPTEGSHQVTLDFTPQRGFAVGSAVSAITALIAVLLVLWPRPAAAASSPKTPFADSRRLSAALGVGVAVVIYLGMGWLGVIALLSAAALGHSVGWFLPRLTAIVLLAIGGLATAFTASSDTIAYADNHTATSTAVQLGLAALAATLVLAREEASP